MILHVFYMLLHVFIRFLRSIYFFFEYPAELMVLVWEPPRPRRNTGKAHSRFSLLCRATWFRCLPGNFPDTARTRVRWDGRVAIRRAALPSQRSLALSKKKQNYYICWGSIETSGIFVQSTILWVFS